MSTPVDGKPAPKRRPVRKILWGVFVANSLMLIFLGIFFVEKIPEQLIITLGISALSMLAFLSLTSRSYYNWTIILLILLFGVNFIIKKYRLPGTDLITIISATLIFLHLIVFSARSLFVLKHNAFLKWLGFATGFTLAVFILILINNIMNLFGRELFYIPNYVVSFFLIIIIITLIFKLPGINFSTWLPLDMKIFYRQIIVPLIVIFSFSIIYNVFPDVYTRIFWEDYSGSPWNMKEIELYDLEGI